MLRGFTGIDFYETKNFQVMSTETGKTLREYSLSGSSYGVLFDVKFAVNEEKLEVVSLEIKVSPKVKKDIEQFINS